MKKIQSLLKTKPDAERVNLSFLQIESINDLIFELFHFDKLKEIDLSCNRLTGLPKDLSILRTVERVDLSSNLFEDVMAVFASLNTMPALKELNLTYDPSRLKHTVSYYMPKLEVINGEVIKAGGEALLKNPIVKVNEGKVEIERSKSSSSKRLLHNNFLLFDDEFVCIRTFFQHLVIANQENNANPKYQTREFIEDNKRIDTLVRQAHEFNESLMNRIEGGEITKNIECLNEKKKMIKELVGAYTKLLKGTSPKQAAIIEPLFKLLFIFCNNIEQQGATLKDVIGAEKPDKEKEANKEVKEAPKEEKRDNDTEKALLKLKLAEMESEMHELRKENDDLYKFLISHSKSDVLKFTKKMNKKYVQKPGDAEVAQKKETKESAPGKDLSATKDVGKKNFMAMKGYTLRQMNDLIYDIMENKKAYDARVKSKLVEPETLENFLYLYFKQKYGLKDLIMVEVASVVERIKSFSDQSAEVDVFKKVLKNELDEKFYWLLQSIKQNLKGKLENYYRTKVRKNASLVEIGNFVQSRLNGSLEFEEAEYLLENSSEEKEFKVIKKKFRDYFDIHAKDSKEKAGKAGLSYFDFLEFIFRAEIEKHLSLLTHISQFFARADEDKDGLISKKQFLGFMDIYVARNPKLKIDEILADADPANLNKITFSKVVEVLGAHFADDAKKVNLIQYLHTV